jgi:hypothetical protein
MCAQSFGRNAEYVLKRVSLSRFAAVCAVVGPDRPGVGDDGRWPRQRPRPVELSQLVIQSLDFFPHVVVTSRVKFGSHLRGRNFLIGDAGSDSAATFAAVSWAIIGYLVLGGEAGEGSVSIQLPNALRSHAQST